MRPPISDRRAGEEAPAPPEVLFREAHRRRRRRWLLGSALLVVAAAVGIAFGAGVGGPGHRPHLSSTPTTAASPETATTIPKSNPAGALFGLVNIAYTTGVTFLNPTDGFAIFRTDEGTRLGTCGRLFVGKTTNGGGQFSSVAELPGCRGDAVTFDEEGDGFVYGPGLYLTHGDARSWAVVREPGTVLSVRAAGNSVWMLRSACSPVDPTTRKPCDLAFSESEDGGRSWQQETFPTTALTYTHGGDAQPQSLVRIGTSAGYVVAPPPRYDDVGSVGSSPTVSLWFTSDAGRSWTKREIPCGELTGVPLGDAALPHERTPLGAVLSAAPTGALFAVCSYAYPFQTAQSQYWTVLTSTDGGVSWSKRASRVFGGKLGKLDAVSSTTAYELGFHGGLVKTTDGGVSWLRVKTVGYVTGTYAVTFFDPADGVALDNSKLWHTKDGGATWRVVVPVVVATSAPSCTAGQLQVSRAPGARANGHVLYVVLLTNTGPTCTLSGFPVLFGTSTRGRRVEVTAGGGAWFGTLVPTILDHGARGQLWLQQSTTTCTGTPATRVDDLVADLPGGAGRLRLEGLSLTLACGITVTQLGIPPKSPATPGSVASLRVGLQPELTSGLPGLVVGGSLLHYTVTLTNLTSSAVPMTPCPSYTVVFRTGTNAEASKRGRVLSRDTSPFACRTVKNVGPGGSAHVSLSVRVPDVSRVTAELLWKFDVPGVVTPPESTSTTGIGRAGVKIFTARVAALNGAK